MRQRQRARTQSFNLVTHNAACGGQRLDARDSVASNARLVIFEVRMSFPTTIALGIIYQSEAYLLDGAQESFVPMVCPISYLKGRWSSLGYRPEDRFPYGNL